MSRPQYPIILIDDVPHKECGKCNEFKSLDNYNKQKSAKSRYKCWCKKCVKDYQLEHRDHAKEIRSKHRKQNLKKFRDYRREYREKNKEHLRELDRQTEKRRYNTDPNYRIRKLVRGRLRKALKLHTKNGKVMSSKKYGIDFEAIFARIGPCPGTGKEYHLDHFIPLIKFDLDNPDHVKLSHVPENFQWLKSFDNGNKQDKFTKQIFSSPILINILKIIGRYEEACLECFGTTNHEQFEKGNLTDAT